MSSKGFREEEEEEDDSLEALFDACDAEADARRAKRRRRHERKERLTPAEREAKAMRRKEKEERRVRKRARALARSQTEVHRVKNRDQCDCYTDKSVIRAQLHLKAAEKWLAQLRASGEAAPSDKHQYEKRLVQCEKHLAELKTWLMALKRTEDNAQARASRFVEAFAVVTQPLLDINVVRREGAPLKVSHYDRWSFLDVKPKPKTRT